MNKFKRNIETQPVDLSAFTIDDNPEVKYGLPKEVEYCSRCVISNQKPITTIETKNNINQKKPTTSFNDDGVCDACLWADYKENHIDWGTREKELEILLDRFRSKDGQYDVVVPGSGGKDSAFAAHILKEKYGMHPLTVTWAPHLYTDIGRQNLERFIHAGYDNILITPNGELHSFLTYLAFMNLGHPFQPFILGQRNVGPRIAKQHGIKLVFYGENVGEYGNKWQDNLKPHMDEVLFTKVNIDDDGLMIGGCQIRELRENYGIKRSDLLPYSSLKREDIRSGNIEMHYMSYYLPWIPQENYYYATKYTGYEPNDRRTDGTYSKYAGIDDKIEPFHFYTIISKFGIGRATYDAAQEIRTGHITREEAIALIRRYDTEFPKRYFKDFLSYVGIDEATFHDRIHALRSPNLWRYNTDKDTWTLRHQIKQ